MNKFEDMTNEELVTAFYQFWKETGVSRSNIGFYVRNHHKELYAEIKQRTIKLNQYKRKHKNVIRDVSFFERIYCLEHNLDDRPMCKECKTKHVAGFIPCKNAYCEYCCQQCERHSSIQAQKGLETKKQKYGKDNITNNKKAYKTRLDKYGSYHSKDYASKVKATKKRRHGDENYINVEKMKQTVEQHKKENPNYYYDREQKTKQTKVANGHDPNWNNREKFKKTLARFTDEKKESIKQRRKNTCLADYGYEFPMQSPQIKENARQTNISTYGVASTFNLPKSRENMSKAIRQKAWDLFQAEAHGIVPLVSEEEFVNNTSIDTKKTLMRWKCKTCGHEFEHTWANWHKKCPKCFPQNYKGMQTEVEDFVKSICSSIEVRRDCKSVLSNARQLDIYIPSLSTAIEFNGLFWHNSDRGAHGRKPTPMMYHYNKSKECEEKGIRLVHIFEDEWLANCKLCKSKLAKLLCPDQIKHIDGGQCYVDKHINALAKHRMLCKYSFDGDDGSSVQYGLKHNGHLVAMMTFSKTRNNKQYEWQVLNYIEVNSFIVDNGFKTLLSCFIDDFSPASIAMYASRDWTSKEDFIDTLDYVSIKKPRLFWAYGNCRIKGSSITSVNAHSFLQEYDSTKSFLENMNSNGYWRIYDSGTILFEKHFKSKP